MKRVHLLLITLLLLGVWTVVSAQEVPTVLKGKTPFATATCPVDKHYVMGKDKPLKRPCILFMDIATEEMVGYALIFDERQVAQAVIEVDFSNADNPKQKVVWRKGQVSL